MCHRDPPRTVSTTVSTTGEEKHWLRETEVEKHRLRDLEIEKHRLRELEIANGRRAELQPTLAARIFKLQPTPSADLFDAHEEEKMYESIESNQINYQ